MSKGSLFIISSPSGGGKTSLIGELVSQNNLTAVVSHTTRSMRKGEKNGVDYNFISKEKFTKMEQNKEFLESAQVFDNFYGTSFKELDKALETGDIVLNIDWQGASQIRGKIENIISIFILPPSTEALKERLVERNLDDPEVIRKRLEQVQLEISHYEEYDYLVVNDDFNSALQNLQAIIDANKCSLGKQKTELKDLLKKLVE